MARFPFVFAPLLAAALTLGACQQAVPTHAGLARKPTMAGQGRPALLRAAQADGTSSFRYAKYHFDFDDDEHVDRSEVIVALYSSLGHVTVAQRQARILQAFDAIDVDHDGRIAFGDLHAGDALDAIGCRPLDTLVYENILRDFRQADHDDDGRLTASEMVAANQPEAIAWLKPAAKERLVADAIKRFDLSQDGTLGVAEFGAATYHEHWIEDGPGAW